MLLVSEVVWNLKKQKVLLDWSSRYGKVAANPKMLF